MNIFSLLLIIFGVIYILKPDLFKRWFWTKTSIAQRLLKPNQYLIYMRVLGAVFILIGIILIFFR